MKFLNIIFLLFIIQCAGPLNKVEKVYICGDHRCANKAEADEYFDNNISIEIYSIETKKETNENLDLAELNLLKEKLITNDNSEGDKISSKLEVMIIIKSTLLSCAMHKACGLGSDLINVSTLLSISRFLSTSFII